MTVEQLQFDTHRHNGIDGSRAIKQASYVSVYLPGAMPATATNYGVFFIAQRNCIVKDFYEVHGVAGTNAGAVTLQLERLQGTETLDGGDALLQTAVNLKGTASTVTRGLLVDNYDVSLKAGDRLALKDAGTLTDVAGLCVTVTIEYEYI